MLITVTATDAAGHATTTTVDCPVASPTSAVRLGVATLDWAASTAQVGPLRSQRLYCGPGETLAKHAATIRARAAQGVLCVVSLKSPGLDWTQLRTDAATLPAVVLAVDHEPLSDYPAATWVATQHQLVAAVGNLPNVTTAVIMNGWAFSSSGGPQNRYAAQGGNDAWLPSSLTSTIDVLAADFYDGGIYPNVGESPGARMRNFRTFCVARGVTRMGAGEVGTFDMANMADTLGEVHDFEWACWWDHAEHHSDLTGSRGALFQTYLT